MVRVIDLKVMNAEAGVKVCKTSVIIISLELTLASSSCQDNGSTSSSRDCQTLEDLP